MQKNKIVCLILLAVLSVAVCCQIGYSDEPVLTLDNFPSAGESSIINSDGILTVNAEESAVIQGTVYVNGTDDTPIQVEIVNYGELTINSTTINCNSANFTIQNRGNLTIDTCQFTVIGNSTLNIGNTVECSLFDVSFDVYGGFAYVQNVGSLTVQNGYFKDQFDGTFISNYGDASFSECTFVANGAEGKIELFNSGDVQVTHGVFDVNYGGKININTLTGTLEATDCSMDVSGTSHGSRSEINILGDNATWSSCSFVNNDAKINYLNTGAVSLKDCNIQVSSVNASTIITNNGPMVLENFVLSGSGSTIITSWDVLTLKDCSFDTSHSLTVMNNEELKAEDWLVKTSSNTAYITLHNAGNITFNVPFIENVESSTLVAIGEEGQEFVEASGGIIKVTNNGLITKQTVTVDDSDSILLYSLIGVIAVAVIIVVFLFNRKNKQNEE
ncbi:MAG: hypothetical protein NWF03_04745 [Candidatus Bathyarchaeota archaeon]|nr:hypothetical protein [Candidatus Bathyarchaeota archaeon]